MAYWLLIGWFTLCKHGVTFLVWQR